MSVYVCEFCGKFLHCDFGNLKTEAGCPFGPCFSVKCFEMMRRFNDRIELCCDSCYEIFQLIKKGILNPCSLKRAIMCMDDRASLSTGMLAEKMLIKMAAVDWQKEEFLERAREQGKIHETKAKNALRRKAPTSTFWQRR